uniref:Uncharacterized protein n=1 Tax=Pipistrellus kuhlii TaxID=59472 RepID=A0A7J7YYM5_PIPKU|nr:hypothetical protein mPipKuh1_009948 [Pipistrellus kuhlii]
MNTCQAGCQCCPHTIHLLCAQVVISFVSRAKRCVAEGGEMGRAHGGGEENGSVTPSPAMQGLRKEWFGECDPHEAHLPGLGEVWRGGSWLIQTSLETKPLEWAQGVPSSRPSAAVTNRAQKGYSQEPKPAART